MLAAGLRADPPGEEQAEAAFLAPFADELSLLATAAYAQSPDPFVSLGSLLTGRYPSAVPLCGSIRRDPGSPLDEAWCHQLPSDVPNLAGVLALYGYRSMLVHGLGPIPGLVEPFEHVLEQEPGATDWATLDQAVSAWWASGEGGPRLLVLQLGDLDLPRRPDLLGSLDDSARDWAGLASAASASVSPPPVERLRPRRPPCTPLVSQQRSADLVWDASVGGEILPTRARAELLAAYRGEARAVGGRVHALLGALDTSRERHVLLAGLHGVSVGELGGTLADESQWVWSDRVADRTVHVPLAWIAPGRPLELVEHPVELVDVLPTMLAQTDAVPPHGLPGGDLLEPTRDASGELAYVEYGDMLALRQGDLLLSMRAMVHNISSLDPYLTEVLSCPGMVGGFSLHDVREDPFQETELLESREREALALEALMTTRRLGPGAPAPVLFEGDRLLRLRLTSAEGYW